MAGPTIDLASGPVGHVISTGRALWYSAEGVRWQRVHRAPALRVPGAGDEGFVAPTGQGTAAGAPIINASGDGLTWIEGAPPASIEGVTAWRGDWLGWAYTENPTTISILSSGDGLDWTVDFDVNDLTPADGPKAGQGLESEITQVTLSGEGGVVAMTLGWNHCCAMPPAGSGVYLSTDAETWTTRAPAKHLRDVPRHRWRGRGDDRSLRSRAWRDLLGRGPLGVARFAVSRLTRSPANSTLASGAAIGSSDECRLLLGGLQDCHGLGYRRDRIGPPGGVLRSVSAHAVDVDVPHGGRTPSIGGAAMPARLVGLSSERTSRTRA